MEISKVRFLLISLISLVVCVILYGYFSHIRATVQVYNDNETSEHYRKGYLKNGAALHIYIDSASFYSLEIKDKNNELDSVIRVVYKKDSTIKVLKYEIKKIRDTISANRVRVYDIRARGN